MNRSIKPFSCKKLASGIAAVVAISASGNVLADPEILNLDIKSQDAGSALMELANSSRVQIMISEGAAERIRISTLKGNYTLENALDVILSGSGLKYEYESPRVCRRQFNLSHAALLDSV